MSYFFSFQKDFMGVVLLYTEYLDSSNMKKYNIIIHCSFIENNYLLICN